MGHERNKDTERRLVAEALNRGNLAVLDDCLTPDFIYHGPGGTAVKGIAGYKKFLAGLRRAYPDIHIEIENILGEGDLVATRTLCTFTARGQRPGSIKLAGSVLDRFAGGKIAETWEQYDRLDLYRQLGLIPANPRRDKGVRR